LSHETQYVPLHHRKAKKLVRGSKKAQVKIYDMADKPQQYKKNNKTKEDNLTRIHLLSQLLLQTETPKPR
jgi:hypothetical protein